MELLRKVASFGTGIDDLKNIYILYVRSLLEQSATVWHSSLTEENQNDLERVQKTALKVILGNKFKSYKNALSMLNIETLTERREQLCLSFALKASKHPKTKQMFPLNEKKHVMGTRNQEKYVVHHAHTDILKDSAIIFMQNLLMNMNSRRLMLKEAAISRVNFCVNSAVL